MRKATPVYNLDNQNFDSKASAKEYLIGLGIPSSTAQRYIHACKIVIDEDGNEYADGSFIVVDAIKMRETIKYTMKEPVKEFNRYLIAHREGKDTSGMFKFDWFIPADYENAEFNEFKELTFNSQAQKEKYEKALRYIVAKQNTDKYLLGNGTDDILASILEVGKGTSEANQKMTIRYFYNKLVDNGYISKPCTKGFTKCEQGQVIHIATTYVISDEVKARFASETTYRDFETEFQNNLVEEAEKVIAGEEETKDAKVLAVAEYIKENPDYLFIKTVANEWNKTNLSEILQMRTNLKTKLRGLHKYIVSWRGYMPCNEFRTVENKQKYADNGTLTPDIVYREDIIPKELGVKDMSYVVHVDFTASHANFYDYFERDKPFWIDRTCEPDKYIQIFKCKTQQDRDDGKALFQWWFNQSRRPSNRLVYNAIKKNKPIAKVVLRIGLEKTLSLLKAFNEYYAGDKFKLHRRAMLRESETVILVLAILKIKFNITAYTVYDSIYITTQSNQILLNNNTSLIKLTKQAAKYLKEVILKADLKQLKDIENDWLVKFNNWHNVQQNIAA